MSNDPIVYPYIPNSVPEIKAQMLEEIGAAGIEDLYAEIPSHLRLGRRLNLPEPILDEASIKRHVERLLQKNRNCSEHLNFLGPAVLSTTCRRSATRSITVLSSSRLTWGSPMPIMASGRHFSSTPV